MSRGPRDYPVAVGNVRWPVVRASWRFCAHRCHPLRQGCYRTWVSSIVAVGHDHRRYRSTSLNVHPNTTYRADTYGGATIRAGLRGIADSPLNDHGGRECRFAFASLGSYLVFLRSTGSGRIWDGSLSILHHVLRIISDDSNVNNSARRMAKVLIPSPSPVILLRVRGYRKP